MPHWEVFEEDKDYVIQRFREGFIDYIEVVGKVAEATFFRHFLERGDIQELAATYPTPRRKEEVPLWLYLCSELTLRLHGAHGYGGYPYVIHCGGLREALGPGQAHWAAHPETGKPCEVFEGYNRKNAFARATPCDPDFLRKISRDTGARALLDWFNADVQRYLLRRKAFDARGIFLLDGSYLFVPDNENYRGSSMLRFDEHNHPISAAEEKALPEAARRRCTWQRCYKAVTLLHTDPSKDFFLYSGARLLSGRASETPFLRKMVPEFVHAVGKGVMKTLIYDRGFIDGAAVALLKEEYGVDSVFPLKKKMTIWDEARRLSEVDGTPWQIWTPPPPTPLPIPPQRPEHIRRREEKRQETRKERGIGPAEAPVTVLKVELKAIREHRTWDACRVPVHVILLREHRSNGKLLEWALATTKDFEDPLEVWELYEIRTAIEERHRQLKCFWDLTSFRSPAFSLVLNQVVFVLFAYTLIQLFLKETENGELAGKLREHLLQSLLPEENKVYIYCDNRFGIFTGVEQLDLSLSLKDGARRRMKGKTRRLLRQRRKPPELPPRPTP